MPAIRSSRSPRVAPSIAKYTHRSISGSSLGEPFVQDYNEKYWVPEFTENPPKKAKWIPKDIRTPPLTLKDLKCIRLLGEGQGKVFLVSREGEQDDGGHPMDIGAVFALKGMRRKSYRSQGPMMLDKSLPDYRVRRNLEKHHSDLNLERNTLACMDWSPWVAGLVQSFDDSQMLYMALEYIPGGTLRSLLRKTNGGLSLAHANFYFANLVCALEFLEKQEIVHRDLKPENILIGLDGYLVLTDFGSSARIDDNTCDWKDLGTPFYMAPELRLESEFQPQEIPHALDWWASGCILFEMMTGKLAFCGVSIIDTQIRTLHAIEWPVTFKLGTNLSDLVDGLLEVEPEQRLGSLGAEEVQSHPWLANVDWSKMSKRRYLAPYFPKAVDLAKTWQSMPLPKQSHIPGLTIVEPPIHLAHDNRYPERPFI